MSESNYYTVSRQNMAMIARRLARGDGCILIGRRGYDSTAHAIVDARFDLFEHPVIKGRFLDSQRGSIGEGDHARQTGWEKDREYLLRRLRKPSRDPATSVARSLFETKPVGKLFEFKIGFQEVAERSFLDDGDVTIFVPRNKSRRPALLRLLKMFVYRINYRLITTGESDSVISKDAVSMIVEYIIRDLETGEVFRRNVQAGQDSDALVM
jgi:hypothetical protein